MRKGQIKIIESAKRHGCSDACIRILSREDLTLRQLESLLYLLLPCREQNDLQWLEQYIHVARKEDIGRLIRIYIERNPNLSYDELRHMETAEQLCSFLSSDDILCESLFDAEFLIRYGYGEHAAKLFQIARCLHDEFTDSLAEAIGGWRGEWDYWKKMDEIALRFPELSEYEEIWSGIRFSDWDDQYDYLELRIDTYFVDHCPFRLKTAKGLPKEIEEMDFHGYEATVQVKGTARFVSHNSKVLSFSISPYDSADIRKNGNIHVEVSSKKVRTILFFHTTKEFMTAFHTAGKTRYRPSTLRDLYQSISISSDDEDDKNAMSVIDYLCNRYQTYLFRDLYEDFLAWKCLLLPITIADAANYHNRKELFQKHYKMPVAGDWNRKNANLSYLILKLHRRLSANGLARAMQCSNAPVELYSIGRSRFRLAWILYSALYSIRIHPTLGDAIREEYDAKQIHLLPEAQTIRAHNAHHYAAVQKEIPEVTIHRDTKFQRLIDEMPSEFELIRTKERICEEAAIQHNCVATYADSISHDHCMIYSVLYQDERHTIEIIRNGGFYSVRQCFRSCNRAPNPALTNLLATEIQRINQIPDN